MDPADVIASAPHSLRASSDRPDVRYERADDLVALHGTDAALPGALRLEADTVVVPVEALTDDAVRAAASLGPVYRRAAGGAVAVPTGSVLVRFSDGDAAERHRDAIEEAGFELAEVLAYAPHAGWVRSADGTITAALRHLERLEALPGVQNVEPQMLSERRHRT